MNTKLVQMLCNISCAIHEIGEKEWPNMTHGRAIDSS